MTFLTVLKPLVSTNNATTTPLAGGGTYTGTSEDVTNYATVTVSATSDVASASNGVSLQFSTDATNWDFIKTFSLEAGSGDSFTTNIVAQYFRVVYTNGASAQSTFRLSTLFNPYLSLNSELNNINSTLNGGLAFQPFMYDAFLRLRVSQPQTLLDWKTMYEDQISSTATTLTAGGGTLTTSNIGGYSTLSVTTTGDRVVNQSRRYLPYQPGKGFQVLVTGTLAASGLTGNYTSKMGYFDDEGDKTLSLDSVGSPPVKTGNGYFFEYDGAGGVINVVERSFTTGSQVDNKVPQSSWNIDKMDGTGPSGITADFTKRNIYVIEMEWLGVGTVVMGMVIARMIYFVHTFFHANGAGTSTTLPYITRPTLPVRYELESEGGAGSLIQICSTVISDGGFQPSGKLFAVGRSSEVSGITTTEVPLIALRLRDDRKRVTLNLLNASFISSTSGNMNWQIYRFLSPTTDPLTGSSWVNANDVGGTNTDSAAEYDVSATAVTFTGYNVKRVAQGYYTSRDSQDLADLKDKSAVTADIAGNSDIIVVTLVRIGGGNQESGACALQWQEWD